MTDTNRNPSRNWLFVLAGGSLVIILCVGVLLLIARELSVFIAPDERGVVISHYEQSGYRSEILEPGYHFLKPGETVVVFDIGRQTYVASGNSSEEPGFVEATTSDGQKIQVDISVMYAVNPEKVLELYINWQDRYRNELVRPASRNATRKVVTQYTFDQILAKRDEIEKAISEQMGPTLAENSIFLLKFDLLDIRQADK